MTTKTALSTEDITAIWENLCQFSLEFGKAIGSVHEEPAIRWAHTGRLALNRILGARFAVDEADERVAEVTAAVASWRKPATWMVDPWGTPNLVDLLLQHGWSIGDPWPSWTGMARRLDAPIEDGSLPAGIIIEEVTDAGALRCWTAARFAEMPAAWQQDYIEVFDALGCGGGRPWSFYQAVLNGEPVSFGFNYYRDGVAGIYLIATHASLRRQGIGTAITRYAMQQAQHAGYPLVILQASAMGDPIYRNLEFGEYCRIALMNYTPG